MKKDRRIMDDVDQFTTLLGPNSKFVGTISGSDNCIVNGFVEGDCDLEGVMVLGEDGRWEGDIRAPKVIISGQVEGSIVVTEKLELTHTARVKGSISCPVIAIADGAVHIGAISMQGREDVVRFKDQRQGKRQKQNQDQDQQGGVGEESS